MAASQHPVGLIDTDIMIDEMRGDADAQAFIAAQQRHGLLISIVTAMELVVGCRNALELVKMQRFLHSITILPINDAASQTAYGLIENFTLSHSLQMPDALIAASALEHSLPLYTKNLKHFHMIPGLKVVRPY